MTDERTYRMLFLGPPGSGKGTYAERLAKKYGIPHIATGDILRELVYSGSRLGNKIKTYLDKGELVPDEMMVCILDSRFMRKDTRKGWILDGFPRTLPQAKILDEIVDSHGWDFDYIFYVWASNKEIIERTVNRVQCEKCGAVYNLLNNPPAVSGVCDKCGGRVYRRDDDTEDMIQRRFDVYEEKTRPVIEYYSKHPHFFKIYTGGPMNLVEKEILSIIGESVGDV